MVFLSRIVTTYVRFSWACCGLLRGWRALGVLGALAFGLGGCNQILGNETHEDGREGGAVPNDLDATMASDAGPEDTGAHDGAPSDAARIDATVDGAAEAATAAQADGGGTSDGGSALDGSCGALTGIHTCGSCTNDCANLANVSLPTLACNGGHCAYGCASGYADCADAGVGCGTSLGSTSNCGGCGIVCSGNSALCAQGDGGAYACASSCTAGQSNCNGTCATLATDSNNCGACGKVCASAEVCTGGACQCPSSATPTLCGNACVSLQTDNANCGSCGHACSGGETCQAGACACPSGQTLCGTTCVNASTDSLACGASCTQCSGGTSCQGGSCLCQTGMTLCAGTCVNVLGTDVNNCGACGTECSQLAHVSAAGLACTAGKCSYQCASDFGDCGNTGKGCATSLGSTSTCGSCTTTCSGATPACQLGTTGLNACVSGCATGQANCSGTCTTLSTDSLHCGSCTMTCQGGETCQSSACACTAAAPSLCTGVCVNEQTDNANCGGCANKCPAAESCSAGKCACTAAATPDFCSPSCTNLQTDNTNCGKCGTTCGTGLTCLSGKCGCAPGANPTQCGSSCTNTSTDASNCGVCANVCPSAETCASGACGCHTAANPNFCNGACTNNQTDNSNCGSCGHTCEAGTACSAGGCVCSPGTIACTTSCPTGVSCIKPTALAMGVEHTCALLSTGTMECWGDDLYGEIGNGATANVSFTSPVPVPNVSNVSAIAAGGLQTCALVGATWECWGSDGEGQIGVPGPSNVNLTPTAVLSGATSFSTGDDVTCAVVSGSVECLGYSGEGELGSGLNGPQNCLGGLCAQTPVAIASPLLTGVTAVSASSQVACAIVSGGSVVCWGEDSYGELGVNMPAGGLITCDNGGLCTPTPVVVSGVNNAIAIATGGETFDFFACALLQGGSVVCWGQDDVGELGHASLSECTGNQLCSAVPLAVTGVSNATAIAAGVSFACALIQGGTVECWGNGASLGASVTGTCQGSTNPCSTAPVKVTGITNATAIAAGGGSACALLQTGAVQCWGTNGGGDLGNGTNAASITPANVQW